ncbi:unnamed protein product [Camellia sinensis]
MEQKIWNVIPLAIFWSIWNLRNECVFNGRQPVLDELCEAVKVRIALWVKYSSSALAYSVNNLVHNLQQVRICIGGADVWMAKEVK